MKLFGIFILRAVIMGVGTYFVMITTPWLFDTRPLTYETMVFRMSLLFMGYGFLIIGLWLLYVDWKRVRSGK